MPFNRADYMAEYRIKNKEKIKEKKREYYRKNKLKVDLANRAFREANPDKVAKYKKDFWLRRKDNIEYKKKAYLNLAKWRMNNRMHVNSYANRYYYKLKLKENEDEFLKIYYEQRRDGDIAYKPRATIHKKKLCCALPPVIEDELQLDPLPDTTMRTFSKIANFTCGVTVEF